MRNDCGTFYKGGLWLLQWLVMLAPHFSVTDTQPLTLTTLRERLGLTQQELAEELTRRFALIESQKTIGREAVSNWETGKHQPRLTPGETLQMCDTLRCSLSELAGIVTSQGIIDFRLSMPQPLEPLHPKDFCSKWVPYFFDKKPGEYGYRKASVTLLKQKDI